MELHTSPGGLPGPFEEIQQRQIGSCRVEMEPKKISKYLEMMHAVEYSFSIRRMPPFKCYQNDGTMRCDVPLMSILSTPGYVFCRM